MHVFLSKFQGSQTYLRNNGIPGRATPLSNSCLFCEKEGLFCETGAI